MRLYAFTLIALLFSTAAQGQFFPNSTPSPWDDATLYRDEWGVPHVFANDARSMAFVFGYAQAEDHLETMLLGYRVANGRAAEVLGEPYAESDAFAQVMRYRDNAQRAYETADAVTVDLCEGFAQGVNAWILEHPRQTPTWAEPVAPADILAFLQYYLLSMAPFDHPEIYHPERGTPGANAWALAPKRSVDDKAVLVINPQQDYDSVFRWYEAHLVTRDMNMYGATLYGLPVILQGHNEHLGWGLSPNEPDIADLYIEYERKVLQAAAPNSVSQQDYYRSQDVNFTQADTRTLYVWEAGQMSQRPLDRLSTRHGPVVGYFNGRPLAYRVGGYRLHGALRQVYDMGRATDLISFRSALDRMQLPVFHVVYADKLGEIFYRYNAKTGWKDGQTNPLAVQVSAEDPKRWWSPLSALDSGVEWGPDVMPAELPWVLNPDSGYVQASGTPPWRVTEGSPLDASDVPAWLAMDADSYRAKRLRKLLGAGRLRFTDHQALLFDRVSPLAAETVPYLLKAADARTGWVEASHPDVWVALDTLRAWDFVADADSVGMTLFHVWWSLLESQGVAETDEALHAVILSDVDWAQNMLLESLAEAARLIRNEYQTLDVPWGRVHVLRRGTRDVPMSGSVNGQSLFAVGDGHFERGAWRVERGPGFAMAVQFDDVPKAVSLTPFGTSEVAESPHFADQLDLMLERRMKVTRFTRADVENHAVQVRGKAIGMRSGESGVSFLVQAPEPIQLSMGIAPSLSANLPEGAAVFSRFVEPIVEPRRIPVVADMEFYVPESVCGGEHLPRLAVYGYRPQTGWQYIQDQELDPGRRTIWARGYAAQVYAVLGPREYLAGDVRLATYRTYEPAGDTGEFEGGLAGTGSAELSNLERERIAKALPVRSANESQNQNIQEPAIQRVDGGIRLHGNTPIPQVPPGWTPDRFDPRPPFERGIEGQSAPPRGTMLRPSNKTSDELPEAEVTDPLPQDLEFPIANDPPQEMEVETPEVEVSVLPEPDVTRLPAAAEEAPSPAGEPEPNEANSPDRLADGLPVITSGSYKKRNSRLIMSSETPRTLRNLSEAPKPQGFYLAPDPNRASLMEIGTSMELRPPVYNALFLLKTSRSVRGQVAVLDRPPAPYPSGLAAFTPVLEVLHDPGDAQGSVVINIKVEPAVCRPDSVSAMNLYAYDAGRGWSLVEGQKKDPSTQGFGAMDRSIRTYVVLGPASARLRPPSGPR